MRIKLVFIILFLTLIISFFGCSKSNNFPNKLSYDNFSVKVTGSNVLNNTNYFSCSWYQKNNKIYCFGGDDANYTYYSDVLEYDPKKDKLVNVTSLPTKSSALKCVGDTTNRIYCLGGINLINNTTLFLDDITEFFIN